MVPIVPEPLPDLSGVPVLAVSGRYDPIVPVDEADQLVYLLRKAGAEVSGTLENAGHGLTEATVEIARRWLENRTPALNRSSL
jgi:phospholipase/carboxylesterase